jgi:AcrR family transcriptional regulator
MSTAGQPITVAPVSPSEELILKGALHCFVQKGYHGTSIREVAERAGMSVPGLYHHFPRKAALLERLIDDTMDDLIDSTEQALAAAGTDPVDRLDAVVVAHVRFHTERPEESFVGNSELRSLSPAALKRVVGKRDRQQRMFDEAVQAGVDAGAFGVEWPREASRAIVTMCTAVATWFRRGGPLTAEQIVEIYRQLARNAVGYDGTQTTEEPRHLRPARTASRPFGSR